MTQIHLVWATTGASRTVLHALTDLETATRFVERAQRVEYDDEGHAGLSPCEALDVQLSIETIPVQGDQGGGEREFGAILGALVAAIEADHVAAQLEQWTVFQRAKEALKRFRP